MKNKYVLTRPRGFFGLLCFAFLTVSLAGCAGQSSTDVGASCAISKTDALPSWRDGASKQAILKFVADVTRQGV
jgi:hypothetical protein